MEEIEDFPKIPLGKAEDLTGKVFGDFKALYRTKNIKSRTYWVFQCNRCSNIFTKDISNIKRNNNNCECNLIGKKFNRLTVIKFLNKVNSSNSKMYECLCDCGNTTQVSSNALKTGSTKSCGCLKNDTINSLKRDIANQKFGKLTALEPTEKRSNGGHVIWKCECDCGNITYKNVSYLTSGNTQSCGCLISKNEENILKLLLNSNIHFEQQKTFENLHNKKFDFYINNEYVLEYDGKQHFTFSNNGWNNKENFEKTRESDLIKNKFCFENNISIIRIPYDVEYTVDDLKLETTRFLLTKNNEKEYYSSREIPTETM